MPSKSKPAEPSVLSLINDKIDTLQVTLSGEIVTLGNVLGARIGELSTTVKAQNGRIGTVEVAHARCQTERMTEARLSQRKQIALLGGGGISGAALLALLKWIGERLHESGLFG